MTNLGEKGIKKLSIHTLGRTCPFRGFREEGPLYSHVGTNFVHFLATGVLPRLQSPNVFLAGVCRYGALQVRCVSVFCASLNTLPSLCPLLFLSLSISANFFFLENCNVPRICCTSIVCTVFFEPGLKSGKLNKPLLFCFALFCFHSFSELLCRARSFALGALLSFLIVFFFFVASSIL